MVVSRRDDAVSEVIGFVLILALIAIIASLYLTYVIQHKGGTWKLRTWMWSKTSFWIIKLQ